MSYQKEIVLDTFVEEMDQDDEDYLLTINLGLDQEEEFEEWPDLQDPPLDALESLVKTSQDYLSGSQLVLAVVNSTPPPLVPAGPSWTHPHGLPQ